MAYPGNPDLSAEAQERVMSAFRQVVLNLQQGQREEAQIGLEFVLRLDPAFHPAVNLHRQLSSGAEEINLADVITQLEAPTTDAINEYLVEAVEDFNQRNFLEAKEKVEKVLLELPGHQEARALLGQLGESLKVEQQVGQFLAQAHEALTAGDAEEAANFVTMAQALDPHHSGIAPTLQEIYEKGGVRRPEPETPAAASAAEAPLFSADTESGEDFTLRFDELEEPEPSLGDTPLSEPDSGPSTAAFALGDGSDADAAETAQPEEFSFPGTPESITEAPADSGGAAEAFSGDLDTSFGELSPETHDDDVSDLFEAEPEHIDEATSDEGDPVQALRSKGAAAFDDGNFLGAIDAWSRIYLLDPANSEIPARIEEAKKSFEGASRRIEHLLFDAQDAEMSGETDKALALVSQILAVQPNHVEAAEFMQRLTGETRAAQPPERDSSDVMPDLEDDLFQEPFDEEGSAADATVEEIDWEEAPSRRRQLFALSSRSLAVAGVAVVILMVVGWIGLRSLLGGSDGGTEHDVYALRAQAEELFKNGRAVQALRLIEQYEPADAAEEKVVGVLIAKYQKAVATPTPTPIPTSFIAARRLLDEGLWYHAYSEALTGLKKHPDDRGLQQLVATVESVEPKASSLHELIEGGKYQEAVGTIHDLMVTHADQADLGEALRRSLFNAALIELRSYNLTGAESRLLEFVQIESNDEEVNRVLEFIYNYKARPVDMQLRVFIQSLHERRGWSRLPAQETPEDAAESTPTPAEASE